uniref:Uncharacterized protein n=1 Tax=Acrobeloides nanus TaxID=290746 RepID=A0A914DM92_9BILA
MAGGGEFLPKVGSQQDEQDVTQEPEVHGVDVEFVTVELTQLGKGLLDVVQVLDGLPEGGEHLLAVGLEFGIVEDGGGITKVPKMFKGPSGPGIDHQHVAKDFTTYSCHIDFGPQGGDVLLLFVSPVHHGGR